MKNECTLRHKGPASELVDRCLYRRSALGDWAARRRRVSTGERRIDDTGFYDIFRFLASLSPPNGVPQGGRAPAAELRSPAAGQHTILSPNVTKSDSDEFGSNESLESSTASTVLEEDQTLPTLGEVLVNHPRILKNCDVKKLIQESLRKGYIRQVEEIPLLNIKPNEVERIGSKFVLKNIDDVSDVDSIPKKKMHWLMGNSSMDEICASLSLSPQLVKTALEKSWPNRVHYVFK